MLRVRYLDLWAKPGRYGKATTSSFWNVSDERLKLPMERTAAAANRVLRFFLIFKVGYTEEDTYVLDFL